MLWYLYLKFSHLLPNLCLQRKTLLCWSSNIPYILGNLRRVQNILVSCPPRWSLYWPLADSCPYLPPSFNEILPIWFIEQYGMKILICINFSWKDKLSYRVCSTDSIVCVSCASGNACYQHQSRTDLSLMYHHIGDSLISLCECSIAAMYILQALMLQSQF